MTFESQCTHDLLKDLVLDCHQFGEFILSSGGKDREYFDLAPLLLSNIGLQAVCFDIETVLRGMDFNVLACYELCPVPLLGAYIRGRFPSIKGLVIRKRRKGHGTNRLIEGEYQLGDKVVIVEDVTSTGASVMKAIRALEKIGCVIVVIVTIINRQEGCDELLKGYNFRWLFTKLELQQFEFERKKS